MGFGMGMACCCDSGCPITADTFDRADNANINTGAPFTWDIRSGAAIINANLLEISTSDTILICGTAHPDNIGSHVVSADVYFGANDPARIIVGHDGTDDDNFHYCEIHPYELALYEMVSGTPSLLACVGCDATGNPSNIVVYFDGATTGRFTATCGSAVVEVTGISSTKKYVGLGLGTVDGGIAFDNFTFAKHKQSGNTCSEFAPDDCDLGSDNFNRADDADPGCGWDEQAGTSAIGSNKLEFTASSSRARFNTSNPDNGTMSVNVDYTSTNDNNTAEIGVGANSAGTTRFYCRITSGTSKTFLIGSTAAGTLSSTTISTTSGSTYAVTVTLDDTRLCASIAGVTGASLSVPVTTPTVESWATLGTAGVAAGSVKFDNFEMTRGKHGDSPTCVLCGAQGSDCVSDCCAENHSQMVVNIGAGLTDKATCAWCSQTVGEFVAVGGPCEYNYCQHSTASLPDPCDCADYSCDADCADAGGFPELGPGTMNCHSGDSSSSGFGCNGIWVRVEIRIDDSGKCYLWAWVQVLSQAAPTDDSPCTLGLATVLAEACYATTEGDDVAPCSGQTYTLTRYDGSLDCGSTIRNGRFFPPITGACNGAWPATITVRSAA